MIHPLRTIHRRELRFLGLILMTGLVIALLLAEGLRLSGLGGVGWRAIDRQALQRRIDSGDLSDREASWYHAASEGEVRAAGAPVGAGSASGP